MLMKQWKKSAGSWLSIWRNRHGFFFLLPSMAGVFCLVLIPFADVVRRSFLTAVTQEYTGIENYRTIFHNQAFLLAVKNTLRFTAVCLPVLIIISLSAAFMLSRIKNIRLIKSMLLFPLAMPAATVVLVWKMVFYKQGFLNLLLWKLGILAELSGAMDYMGTPASFWVLVFSYVWKNLGYTVVLWMAGIIAVPAEILEAARADGASKYQSFFRIVLPNLKGTFFTITVLSFLNSFKVFREAYLVAGSYPQDSMYLLQHLFNNWFVSLDLDKMAAAAVCIALVLFFVIFILQRLWEEKE